MADADRSGWHPAAAPVWFLWDDDSSWVVVYSRPTAKRLARMKANPRYSLHLNDDGTGHNLVVLTGRIAEAADLAPAHQNPAYAEEYRDWMVAVFGSTERFATMFSVPLRFEPTSFRGD